MIAEKWFELLEIGVRRQGGDFLILWCDEPIEMLFAIDLMNPKDVSSYLHFKDENGNKLFSDSISRNSDYDFMHDKGEYEALVEVPNDFLTGVYSLLTYVMKTVKMQL